MVILSKLLIGCKEKRPQMQTKLEDYEPFRPIVGAMVKLRLKSIAQKKNRRIICRGKAGQLRELNQQSIENGLNIMKAKQTKSKKIKRYRKELERLKSDQKNYTGSYWNSVIVLE
jgi:endonuclease YncB( thermonuclease family)